MTKTYYRIEDKDLIDVKSISNQELANQYTEQQINNLHCDIGDIFERLSTIEYFLKEIHWFVKRTEGDWIDGWHDSIFTPNFD